MTAPLTALVAVFGFLLAGCGRTALLALDGSSAKFDLRTGSGQDGNGTSSARIPSSSDGTCPAGFSACGGKGAATRCYDLARSAEHCGQCGNACAPGIACRSSRCDQYRCNGDLDFKALPVVSTAAPSSVTGGIFHHPVLGDFDGDGTLDFVGVTGPSGAMAVLLGKGDGTFEPRSMTSEVVDDWRAAAADINDDGRLDLAIIHPKKSAVVVRLGHDDPAALFEVGVDYPTVSAPNGLLFADLDDDGHVDMVAAQAKHMTVWRGSSSRFLGAPVDLPVGATGSLLATTDWNGDGALDLVFGGANLRMLLGRGDGTFNDEIACGLSLGQDTQALVGDLDHDRKADVVVPMRAFLEMNGCNFSRQTSIPVPTDYAFLYSVGMADLDGDGELDIVSATGIGMSGFISVSRGDGRGGFSQPATFPASEGSGATLLVGDLDHDTKLDIILTYMEHWQVLLNTCR
jgi:hypothetical protein